MSGYDFVCYLMYITKIPFSIALGFLVLWVIYKVFGKSIISLWEQRALQKEQHQHEFELEKQKSYETMVLETQKLFVNSSYEMHLIKIQRVLPLVEEISELMHEYKLLMNTHYSRLGFEDPYSKDLNEKRKKIDEKFWSKISRISCYLPEEIYKVLFRLRILMSCRLKSYYDFNDILKDSEYFEDAKKIAIKIIVDYVTCIHDLFMEYYKVSNKENCWNNVCKKYHINHEGAYLPNNDFEVLCLQIISTYN